MRIVGYILILALLINVLQTAVTVLALSALVALLVGLIVRPEAVVALVAGTLLAAAFQTHPVAFTISIGFLLIGFRLRK